ncbi:MAG: PKD domain-containing protein [Paludibacter sp.]|nr:PKD domain-containing protein [Paludibacter sp.]
MKQKLFFLMLIVISWTTQLFGGNLLQNGNMEAQGSWQVSYLNTATEQYPEFNWNYTTQLPGGGQGGCLYVKAITTSGNSQVAFYQTVTLSSDSVYNFDAVYKNLKLQRSWCEVFIGQAPNEGEDYTTDLGSKIASYGSWDNPAAVAEGSFKLNAATSVSFAPPVTGTYTFIIKMGATTWDTEQDTCEVLLDNLSLTAARVAPVPAFKADVRSGFAPLTVQFTDQSAYATSWLWEFGDGSTSTDENPSHTYTSAGTYDVKLTATNEIGSDFITNTAFIQVTAATQLTGGGVLKNGNMEAQGAWSVDYLNSESVHPQETWNYTDEKPDAGQGGCLLVESEGGSGNIQFAVYQKVHLSADSVYVFDGAIRDLSADLHNYWCEVYVGSQPIPGADYSANDFDATLIAKFDGWNSGSTVAGLNGTFKNNAGTYTKYIPESTGDYYFVLKMGTYDGPAFTIAIDELSLTPLRTKPFVGFSADNNVGFADLETSFSNTTKFADTYLWDFGDGSTSTLENPEHTYTAVGNYTVKLKASNELGDSTLTKEAFVKVNEKPALPEGETLYGGDMENGNYWSNVKFDASDASTLTWNYSGDSPAGAEGGNLRIQSVGGHFNVGIYQSINLTEGYTYLFDGFYKDVNGIADYWCEVYIGDVMPVDGTDYSTDFGTKIANINTWEGSGQFMNGKMSSLLTVSPYKCTKTGTYYFVFKMGSNKSGTNNEILVDGLTLKETLPVKADFYADPIDGISPLTVSFTDLSENATSWEWDFGDGSTSTEQNPEHIYTQGGTFTVKLTASNSGSSDTTIQTDLITVTPTALTKVDADNCEYSINIENHVIKVDGVQERVDLFNISGQKVTTENINGTFISPMLNEGLYIMVIDGFSTKVIVK